MFFYKIRNYIAYVVLTLSLLIGLSDLRVYPFSNFSMFAYSRRTSVAQGLVLKLQDGYKMPLPRKFIWPLTRLNIWQLSRATIAEPHKTDWMVVLGLLAKKELPNIKSIILQDIKVIRAEPPNYWSTDLESGKVYLELVL